MSTFAERRMGSDRRGAPDSWSGRDRRGGIDRRGTHGAVIAGRSTEGEPRLRRLVAAALVMALLVVAWRPAAVAGCFVIAAVALGLARGGRARAEVVGTILLLGSPVVFAAAAIAVLESPRAPVVAQAQDTPGPAIGFDALSLILREHPARWDAPLVTVPGPSPRGVPLAP